MSKDDNAKANDNKQTNKTNNSKAGSSTGEVQSKQKPAKDPRGRKPAGESFKIDDNAKALLPEIFGRKYPKLKISDKKVLNSLNQDLVSALIRDEAERLGIIAPEDNSKFAVDYLCILNGIQDLNGLLTVYMADVNYKAMNKKEPTRLEPKQIQEIQNTNIAPQEPLQRYESKPDQLRTTPEMVDAFPPLPEMNGEDQRVQLPDGLTGTFRPIQDIIKDRVRKNNDSAKEMVDQKNTELIKVDNPQDWEYDEGDYTNVEVNLPD